ncbi:MAG: Transposase [Phycisphaerales bacterium]|nr:Transposase [Phycisphaerales bacterium]
MQGDGASDAGWGVGDGASLAGSPCGVGIVWGVPSRPIFISQAPRAAHLIWTGYGHWLPNDPRGSGSDAVRSGPLSELGAIHHGRKAAQPARSAVRGFYRRAEPRLLHPVVWFGDPHRMAMAQAICRVVRERGYTLWALAILRNHVHAVIRTHRDKSDVMWNAIATGTRAALCEAGLVPAGHPVWSERPYVVLKRSVQQVKTCVRYVEDNPGKERLPVQRWEFVVPFQG